MAGARARALALLDEALALTRTLGDQQQEADLLWHVAVRRAELGQTDEALRCGQAAVKVLERLGRPQARVYAEHLERYRRGTAQAPWPGPAASLAYLLLAYKPKAVMEFRRIVTGSRFGW